MRVLAGLFFLAHGAVHALYFVPADDPKFPMTPGRSWLVTRRGLPLDVVRALVYALSVLSIVGFCLLALSYWDWVVPGGWLEGLAVMSASTSLLLIAATWNKQFVVGVAINVGVLYWALVWE